MNIIHIALALIAFGLPASALADKWSANEKIEAIFVQCQILEIDPEVTSRSYKSADQIAERAPKIALSAKLCNSLLEEVKSFRAKNGYDLSIPLVAWIEGVKPKILDSEKLDGLLAKAIEDKDVRRIDYLRQQQALLNVGDIFPITLTPGTEALMDEFRRATCSPESFGHWLAISVLGRWAEEGAEFNFAFKSLKNQASLLVRWGVKDQGSCYPNSDSAGYVSNAKSEDDLIRNARDKLFVHLASGPRRYKPYDETQ